MKRAHILEIPGYTDKITSPLGMFMQELKKHTRFDGKLSDELGDIIDFPRVKDTPFINTPLGALHIGDWQWYTKIIAPIPFQKLEQLLNEYELRYVKNTPEITLCCPQATAEAQTVLFLNAEQEKLFVVCPQKPICRNKVIVYIDEFIPKDENAQIAAIRDLDHLMYETGQIAPTGITLHNTVNAAKKYLKKKDNNDKIILKTFSSGEILVGRPDDHIPLKNFFNPKQGLARETIGSCQYCESNIEEKVIKEILARVGKEECSIEEFDMFNNEGVPGYTIQIPRLRVNVKRIYTYTTS